MSKPLKYEILSQWGLIRATGDDAATFLHGQLTQDVETLAAGEARLAAYCNAKGRMQATVIITKSGDGSIYVLTHKTLVAQLCKRLSMFVLRAKCKLADVSETVTALATCGEPLPANTTLATAPWPVGGEHIRLQLVENTVLPDAISTLGNAGFTDSPFTEALQFEQGVAHVSAATFEVFIPQMINLDLVGGVNFQKGCYPGQEIVARSHYLGKQKRRMQKGVASVSADTVAAGSDVYLSDVSHEPAGQVIQVRAINAQTAEILFEVPLDRLVDGVSLHLGSPTGPEVRTAPLPYAIPVKA